MENKKRRRKIVLFVFYGLLTVLILALILSLNDMNEIFDVLKTADYKNVLLATGCLLLYALLSPLSMCILTKSRKHDISFGSTYVIGMTEHFFNGITPFSTGGQPFQVYAFNKAKVKPAQSTGILLMNFIIFMIVTNAFAICSLFFYGRFTAESNIGVIAIVGFSINFLVLTFMIALATSKRLRNLLSNSVVLLARVKFLKKFLEPQIPKINEYFEQVQAAFRELLHRKRAALVCLLVRAVTMAVYYAVTFYILRAFHIQIGYDQIFFVICGTSFAITMVVFLPTPGSSGGIEFAFKTIFASIAGVSATVAYSGMLLWRLLTYYFLMLFSLFFYIGFEIHFRRKKKVPAAAQSEEKPETKEKNEDDSDLLHGE